MDDISSKAPKLAALLSLAPSSKVLLVGDSWSAWHAELREYFSCVEQVRSTRDMNRALSGEGCYDLALLSTGVGDERKAILNRGALVRVNASLSPHASVVLFARNSLCARSLRRPSWALLSTATIAGTCRRTLYRAGFGRVEEFLPLPSVASPEEFVSSLHGDVALPRQASLFERAINRIGALPLFHDGWLYVASRPSNGTHPLLKSLAAGLRSRSPGLRGLCLERFDLRERGALVLLLSSRSVRLSAERDGAKQPPGFGKSPAARFVQGRLVCRIATDIRSDRSASQNAFWTDCIHHASNLPAQAKAYVPHSLGVFHLPSGTAYAEEMKEGAIAWKLVGNPQSESRMFGELYSFLRTFSSATARVARIDAAHFAELARPKYELSVDTCTADLMAALVERLRVRTVDTCRPILWSHGDFGYGNAIAEPRNGTLCGVIDWEQGREDFAGIDLLNFLVQREGMRQPGDPLSLFHSLAERFVAEAFRGLDARLDYDELFPSTKCSRRDIVGWTALRFAQRVGMYPAVLARSRAGVRELLKRACAMLQP